MPTKADLATPPADRRNSPIDALTGYLDQRLDALVDQSIEIAKTNGYAPFTTTIRAAWVEAVISITESLDAYLRGVDQAPSGPQATLDYATDPRFARMRKIARQHRSLGITLQMYVGLFKHFRNLFLEELDGFRDGTTGELHKRVRDFFDETELSINADWNSADDNQRLRELQERTRTLTLDKDRYFAVFESLRNPAFLLDRARNLVNANQAMAELFLGSDAQAGEIVYLRSMRRRKSSLKDVIDEVMDVATCSEKPVWLDTLKGRRCFDIRTRSLHDAVKNTSLGHVVILNDVTAHRREAEEAQQSEQGMSRFLATISHEIRTPLHSVLGSAELLRTAHSSQNETYLDAIETAGKALLLTLSNVLDYSKFENQRPIPRPSVTDLRQVMSSFGRNAMIGRSQCHTALSIVLDPSLPVAVKIDWGMAQQVLSNLVSNALQADGGLGVNILVGRADRRAERETLRFEVQDHGPGLTADAAIALFKPFEHTTPRDTGNGGSGLGLAISHHLVDAMGGEIGYDNRVDGTSVWFEVPVEPADTQRQENQHLREEPVCQPSSVTRCLLVDDDPIGVVVTRNQIEMLGLVVTTASTLAEAKSKACDTRFDVIVTDYLLPDGDGQCLAQDLKSELGERVRFVALTANVEALAEKAEVFDRILAKPAEQAMLSSAIFGSGAKGLPTARRTTPDLPQLQGLSRHTVAAMTDSFANTWAEFRAQIRQDRSTLATVVLADEAHRLAGSCAVLAICEIEPLLRHLEKLCRSQCDVAEIDAVLTKLDLELSTLPSWQRINALVGPL